MNRIEIIYTVSFTWVVFGLVSIAATQDIFEKSALYRRTGKSINALAAVSVLGFVAWPLLLIYVLYRAVPYAKWLLAPVFGTVEIVRALMPRRAVKPPVARVVMRAK